MSLTSILQQTEHRPWPLPKGPWVMTQTWADLLFAHWPIDPDELRRVLPAPLTLDTYEGQAWIGIVPFNITAFRPRWLPSIPRMTTFPEVNVRTYVMVGDKPGVYFFSLDAANWPAVIGARLWFHLPYVFAQMSVSHNVDWVVYDSIRKDPSAPPGEFHARYIINGNLNYAPPGSLPHWLTERYCLYAVSPRQQVIRGEIHHARWPLQPATAKIAVNTLPLPGGLRLPNVPPLLHFAKKLDVAMWPPSVVKGL
ncbi:MAG: DUF2071 domain-containing protein [Anaerolineae bacterium]|nr:DUF2071 domain-containing protein [Anaerolineae bacterium]